MSFSIRNISLLLCLPVLAGAIACTRSTIEFGMTPENNYTRLVYIDTVAVKLSTVLVDSFETGNATSFLLGCYKDPYLGSVTAKPFFQMDKPAVIPEIASNAIYDSITFEITLNDYYYGDTGIIQTIFVNELAQNIIPGYNSLLYNTSNTPVKSVPLGTKKLFIRPVNDDSILIRLDDVKGRELFDKLRQSAPEVASSESFLNYFKGISLSTGENDTAAIVGLAKGDGMRMRIYYHTNTPYDESHYIDFPVMGNTYAFNQVLASRPGTGLVSGSTGITEIPSSKTKNFSFSQPGTGLNLKITFPSLKDVFIDENFSKLLKAELVIRPANQSFDRNKYRLPGTMQLAYTDATDIFGSLLTDSTGQNTLRASPVIDDVYGRDNYYRFNITSYITQLLQLSGNDRGLYIHPAFSATSPDVSRLVLGNSVHNEYITKLQLSVLIVNK